MRLGTAILLAAVVGLLAVGCSSGAGAQPTTLPSITPSQSPVVATVPPQAAANTSQALDAFVRFYFQQLNVAFSTSDASIIRRFSDSRCVTCNNYARGLEADRNAVIRGDSFLLASVAAPPIQASVTMVEVLGSVPPRALVNRDGTLIKSLPTGGQFRFSVSVIRVTEAWRVLSIARGT